MKYSLFRLIAVVELGLLLSASAGAWGFQAHKLINEQAIRMVPQPMQEFLRGNARFVREHAVDPDLWRQANEEPASYHFFEVDAFTPSALEPFPSREQEFWRRVGQEASRHGRLPWRIIEVYELLVCDLRAGNWIDARLQASVLGHYVADAHVPFHATRNYDGQLTGNAGIHSRWESQLVERFEQQVLKLVKTYSAIYTPVSPARILEVLKDGLAASQSVLDHDVQASAGLIDYWETPVDDRYSNTYFSRFYALEKAHLANRLEASASFLAALWYSAWVDAGQPLPPSDVRDQCVRGDHRLVLLSWDGTPPDLIKGLIARGRMPHLKALLDRSVYSNRVMAAIPSMTASGHAAIWTGAWGNRNGVTANQVPYPPSPERSVLEQVSGFSSTALRAEPLWMTAARQGLNVVVLQGIQVFPFDPFTVGGHFAGDQSQRLTLIDGYSSELADNSIIGPDIVFVKPSGWEGLPDFRGEGREFSFNVARTTLYGIVFDDPGDPVNGYDSLLLSQDKTDSKRFLVLKPMDSPSFLPSSNQGRQPAKRRDAFGNPYWLRLGSEAIPVYFRLFELEGERGVFRLYHSWMYRRLSNRPELVEPFQAKAGGFWGHAGIHMYRRSLFGKTLMEGGRGDAERRYLETVALTLRQYAASTELALTKMKWDLLINYVPLPDEVCHAWFGWTDPSSPAYDEPLARALTPYLETAMEMQDDALGEILSALPPAAAVALVSDHGVQGIGKDFLPNVVLSRAGLLNLNPDGSVNLAKTRVYAAAEGAFLLVNSKQRKDGIVEESDRDEVLRLAGKALLEVRDPETGLPVVTRIIDPQKADQGAGLGGPTGGDLYYLLRKGYAPQRSLNGEPVTKRGAPTGNHALDWETAQTGFLISGPGLRSHLYLGAIRLIDLAPTFCRYLGIDLPANAEGQVLQDAFVP